MKININKQAVGSRIKQIRLNKGFTLEAFGKLFGASKGNIQQWENGVSLPNKERIANICKISNITVNELLHGSIDEFIKENYTSLILNSSLPYPLSFPYDEIIVLFKKYNDDTLNLLNDLERFRLLFSTVLTTYANTEILNKIEVYTNYFKSYGLASYSFNDDNNIVNTEFSKLKKEFGVFLINNHYTNLNGVDLIKFLEDTSYIYRNNDNKGINITKYKIKYYPIIKDIFNTSKHNEPVQETLQKEIQNIISKIIDDTIYGNIESREILIEKSTKEIIKVINKSLLRKE